MSDEDKIKAITNSMNAAMLAWASACSQMAIILAASPFALNNSALGNKLKGGDCER